MNDDPTAGTSGTGLGRDDPEVLLDGVSKEISRSSEYNDEIKVDRLVQRMAVMTVRRYANKHECGTPSTGMCDSPDHERDHLLLTDLIEMIGLPRMIDPPTGEERASLLEHLPAAERPADQRAGDTMIRKRKK